MVGTIGRASMEGGAGADLFYGGALADTINADAGNDQIYGFGGNDVFLFLAADLTAGDSDYLGDFQSTLDILRFSLSPQGQLTFTRQGGDTLVFAPGAGGGTWGLFVANATVAQVQLSVAFV